MDIFALEYPGYLQDYPGTNMHTTPRHEEIHKTALDFYDYLLSKGVKDAEIVVIGRSLGTSFASYLARERPQRRLLVCISPFPSLQSVNSFAGALMAEELNLKFYGQTEPTFVLSGGNDTLIRPALSEACADMC